MDIHQNCEILSLLNIQNPYLGNIAFPQITKTEIPAAAVVVSGAAVVISAATVVVTSADVVVSGSAGGGSAAAVVVTAATVVASSVASKNKGFIRCKIRQNPSKL